MKVKSKFITAILLSAGAAAGTAFINQYIQMHACSENLLSHSEAHCFRWRLGNIYYTKEGNGKPLLLIHDLSYASSGCEWDLLIPYLKEHYTVYAIDLLGCGRSEKPNLTYTNFLYVQLINDFIKSEIGHRTNVIATGSSSEIVTMACSYNAELFDQIMFINPESLVFSSHISGKYAKYYKFILDLPIIGTLLYHFASARSNLMEIFRNNYFYNPYSVNPRLVDKYYESAHLGNSPKSVYASVQCGFTRCSTSKALERINNSIYLLCGEKETDIDIIIREYTRCNAAIESGIIASTKHLPQLENPAQVYETIQMFFS